MMKKYKTKIFIVLLLVFISIGFAFLTTNLSISGISFVKQNSWDVHFENIVDDSFSSEVNNPATISSNGKKVNFEVTFNNPGEEYYFYVDVVNDGTLDAMLDLYEVTGLSDEQKNYIEWEITYSDGIELTKYDKLPKGEKDTLKVLVRFKDNIDSSMLPEENETINLTFKSIYVQADKSANEREVVEDKTAPDVNFASNSSGTIKGNNKWYKSLSVLSKLVDPSGISSAKYCVTTSDACTPDQTADIKNNSFAFQLSNNTLGQTICIEGIDVKDNNDVVCSKEKYYVDGEDPTISKVTANSLDDTISITVEASDQYSGLNKYYYSKDGGTSYISSKNNNYTFAGLEPDDYIVMDYVEDNAGNTSNISTTTSTVRIRSWCEKNSITDLGECAIAMEAKDSNISEAKKKIEAKGTPDFSKTSPTYTYNFKQSSSLTQTTIDRESVVYAPSFSIDSNTGVLNLTNHVSSNMTELMKLDFNNKYYLCGVSTLGVSNCQTIFLIDSITSSLKNGQTVYTVNKYNITPNIINYDASEVGMYAMEDDYGMSYYYRGSVGGNFVKFADMYWRIIRINGNGSIRMVYYGNSPDKSSFIETVRFNEKYWDPTYQGYMYNDTDFLTGEAKVISSVSYGSIAETTSYVYAKNYIYDDAKKVYKLDGEKTHGVWNNNYQEILENGYKYTCFSSSETGTCPVLFELTDYISPTSAKVNYHTYGSISYDKAVENKTPSTILLKLMDWYESNISGKQSSTGKSLDEYISDSIFCNDRSLTSGPGYSVYGTTYNGVRRLINFTPQLTCPNKNDSFTVSSDIGNGDLPLSIGLVTIDEAQLAGGRTGYPNELYYLNFGDGRLQYTLTPASFNQGGLRATANFIYANGSIAQGMWVDTGGSLRPVINLDTTKFTFTGIGTKDNPFVVE